MEQETLSLEDNLRMAFEKGIFHLFDMNPFIWNLESFRIRLISL